MIIAGDWQLCEDGITRPVVRAEVMGSNGNSYSEYFLVDTAADRTALSAALLSKLQFVVSHGPSGLNLEGIGGASPYVVVTTALGFKREDGEIIRVHGDFAAFTNPKATDFSILGREVLDLFDVVTSRRRNAVLLLSGNHQYQVVNN